MKTYKKQKNIEIYKSIIFNLFEKNIFLAQLYI